MNQKLKSSCILELAVLIVVVVLWRGWRMLCFKAPVPHILDGVVEVKPDAPKQTESDYWFTQHLAWYHHLPCLLVLRRAHLFPCPQAALFVFQVQYLYALGPIIDPVRLRADPP